MSYFYFVCQLKQSRILKSIEEKNQECDSLEHEISGDKLTRMDEREKSMVSIKSGFLLSRYFDLFFHITDLQLL